ncbi:MAG: NADPH-dependent glutamate synthase [Oscillospiraceae bacterium]|nr:NADPH-dependent glutamate synthase [Oscillospiraceae bacterium]
MPHQEPNVRNKNFKEVSTGYTLEDAINEANRCLNCKTKPCISGCPVNVDIPDFISFIKDGDIESAYRKIKEKNFLPAVCGRVCPQENQCEKLCVRGIKNESVGIGRLERFCADWARENGVETETLSQEKTDKKVAVIGAGPAGLTCAGVLAQAGVEVEIFESLNKAGGVLSYGIPEFRLPKSIVRYEVENLEKLGVKIHTDVIVGRTVTIPQLEEMGFDAFFIGSGAGLPSFMGIEGEGLAGVFSANEFLTRANLMECYKEEKDTPAPQLKKVVVVGGGNVAMDAARVAKRMGSDVSIVYRRGVEQMPARKEEIHHAQEEGIHFLTLNNPVRIIGDENGFVKQIECIKMELTEPDASGRRGVKAVEGSEFLLDVDGVIMAIGTSPNPLLKSTINGIEVNRRGGFVTDENMRTSIPNIWAGGDAVTGSATVIEAMGAGQKAAKSILEYLK